ncbi:DUF262 domain-containing protein [Hymenobacter bucti]|uniref:DUF262 domain-containing protein n=1 Tax=Hymenobacter bucti TaxID=1844114 RepID=A0ABW4QY32_9BACT
MRPTKVSVADIFERERRYAIPLFQRQYVWEKPKQWTPLWEDIERLAEEEVSRMQGNRYGHGRPRNHFIGAVVTAPVLTSGRQLNAVNVIDGQQRLTTLQIVLTALQDVAKGLEIQGVDTLFTRLTRNTYRTEQPFEQFKVWPTTGDQAVFEQVLTAGSRQEVEQRFPLTRGYRKIKYDPRPRLVDAYLYFYSQFENWLLTLDETDQNAERIDEQQLSDRLDALLKSITTRLEIVLVELDEDDDPQVIFESLNGRGQALLPSDLIRNFVFLEANREHLSTEQLYEQYWREFDNSANADFWRRDTRQGRLSRPRLDLFFFHFLTLHRQELLSIGQLYTEFKEWWQTVRAGENVERELQQLRASSDAYRLLFEGPKTSRIEMLVQRLQVLDSSVFYPVLLGLLTRWKTKTDARALDAICGDLESYLVRRTVCGLTPKNYNRVALELLQTLEQAVSIDRAAVSNFLRGLTGESGRWPEDGEFKLACQTQPLYKTLKPARTQMILAALDLQLHTNRQEQLHLPITLSVEHIYPQTPTVGRWDHIEEEDGARVLNQLGNLTLLTRPLNSSISNGAFSRKRPAITRQSLLQLNAYFQDLDDTDEWGVAEIQKRGKELTKLAIKVWPRPAD